MEMKMTEGITHVDSSVPLISIPARVGVSRELFAFFSGLQSILEPY